MKKSSKTKAGSASKKAKPDIAELLSDMQKKLVLLEMKVDVLIERLTIKPPEAKPQTAFFQSSNQPQRQGENRQANGNGARPMFEAICADCSKECSVPFKPREGRDVYCKDCFSKRKSGGPARANESNRLPPLKPVSVIFEHRDLNREKPKSSEKKAPKKAPKKAKKK